MESQSCWQCGNAAVTGLFCSECQALQAPPKDYFQFFGLERKLFLDTKDLQNRFYELSRKLHPDRFTRKPEQEKANSLEASSILNDAYRVLREPVARAEYLLKHEGFDIGEQRSKDVPPELLEEVFELNMALEELRMGDEDARGAIEDARRKFIAMREAIDVEIEELFKKYDKAEDRAVLQKIRGVLNRRRYVRNLVSEVENVSTLPN